MCVSFKTVEDSGDRSHFSGCPEWHPLSLSCLEVLLMFCLLPPGGGGGGRRVLFATSFPIQCTHMFLSYFEIASDVS